MIPQRRGQAAPIIPAHGSPVTGLGAQMFLAAMVGLVLRLLFVLWFPAPAGDSALYLQLAYNWVDHHAYAIWLNGQLVPTDLRMPGYPAFLAVVGSLFGRSKGAILLSQAALDLVTVFLTAALAVALVPRAWRRRAALAGLWFAATCPFVANYTAVVLTEVLATFLGTAALLCFVLSLRREVDRPFAVGRFVGTPFRMFCLGAFLTGLATLVRPEIPLLLVTAAAVGGLLWWKHLGWRNVVRRGAVAIAAFLLPLAPWVARNWLTLKEMQPLSPRYATLPGEYAPVGYLAWTRTWLTRYRDVYQTVWKIGDETVNIDDFPSTAFDSLEERARIAALLDRYNNSPDLEISADVDREFGEMASERTRRNPLRTYAWAPFERALSIWFTPRTELLPSSVSVWPIAEHWDTNPLDLLVAMAFAALNYVYVALAIAGILVARRAKQAAGGPASGEMADEAANVWGVWLLLVYLLVRTAFLTTVEAPEPRYLVPCYPALLALAALLWAGRRRAAGAA